MTHKHPLYFQMYGVLHRSLSPFSTWPICLREQKIRCKEIGTLSTICHPLLIFVREFVRGEIFADQSHCRILVFASRDANKFV